MKKEIKKNTKTIEKLKKENSEVKKEVNVRTKELDKYKRIAQNKTKELDRLNSKLSIKILKKVNRILKKIKIK